MRVLQVITEKQHKGPKGQLKAKDAIKKLPSGTTKNATRNKLVGSTQVSSVDKIDEAPFSDLGTGLKKFGAKAAAKLGAKDTAASMAGDVDRKERSNLIYRRWLSVAGSANINKNSVDAQTLANFMAKQGLPTNTLKTISAPLKDTQVATIIAKAVAQSFDPNAKPSASPVGKPAADKTGSVDSSKIKVKPAMQKQIDALSPEQKKELAALL